jgi:hypothetical protein
LVNRLTEPKLLSLSDFKGEGQSEASLGFPALVQMVSSPFGYSVILGSLVLTKSPVSSAAKVAGNGK